MQRTGLNILLVEDSLSDAKLLQKVLSRISKDRWQVVHVEQLSSAIAACQTRQFDAILLDLCLPDSEGWETVANLHVAVPDIPIVVLTSEDSNEVAIQAMAQGAQDYIVKNEITVHMLERSLRYAIERGQTYKQLRDSQQRFRGIFDRAFQFMGLLTPEGIFLEINQTALNFLQATPQDFRDRFIWDTEFLQDPRAKQWVRSAIAQAGQGQLVREEILLKRGGGIEQWIDFSLKPVPDEAGRVVLLIAEGRDISDRKKAESALEYANEQLQVVLNAVPGFVAWIGEDLRYLGVNQSLADTLSLSAEEFVGQKVEFWQNAPDFASVMYQFMSGTEIAKDFAIDLIVQGKIKHYLFVARKYQKGIAAVAVGIDITERQKAEREIFRNLEKERELNHLKSSFMSMISHDVRNPLSTILLGIQLVKNNIDIEHEPTEGLFDMMEDAVSRICELLNEVLVMNQSQSGQIQCQPAALNLEGFCRQLVKTTQMNAGHNYQINFRMIGDDSRAAMDRSLLQHILSNLLSNAIKYSPSGGRIRFDCICEDNTATFEIQDWGIGIPVADRPSLFATFHRCSNVGPIKGTGLGLSIVKKCTELHGGQIAFESQVGVGTTFKVTLPLGRKEETGRHPKS